MPTPPDLDDQEKRLLGRIPLVIGVSGHRDLLEADEPRLRSEVARAIQRLKKDYLNDDPDTPIIILSALAEGADSLVAEVALEQGAILIAPLPMEEVEYREDFKPGKALRANTEDKFASLLSRALAKVELPYREDSSRTLVQNNEDKRAEQYQDVGRYIVTHCHVLIALWNGESTGLTGGTAEVVDFKRNGIPLELTKDARIALDGSEIGPVIEIMTSRKKAGSRQVQIETRAWGFDVTGSPPRGVRRLMHDIEDFILIFFGRDPVDHHADPEKRTWTVFHALANQTKRFNQEAAAQTASLEGQSTVEKSLRGLFTDYADATGEPAHLDGKQKEVVSTAGRWCEIYQRADALASVRQAEFKSDWLKLFTAGFVAIVLFEAYAHVFDFALLLILYIAALGYGFFLFIRARVRQHQERFLDYRALAEALRVAVYWKVARIGTHVANAYPIKQPSELAWVKIALRALDMLEDGLGMPLAPPDGSSLEEVRRLWIAGQWAYFSRNSKQLNLHAEMREEWSLVALGSSPLIGAIGLGVLYFLIQDDHTREHFRHGMIVMMGLLVGLGAVIAGYTEQLAFKAQGRQYERMSLLFERALLLANRTLGANASASTPAEIQQVTDLYVELGREAMKESADWVAIYRQRPIRPAG